MTGREPWSLGVAEIVSAVRRGELAPVELVTSLLARCDDLDADLQAWVTLDADGALKRVAQLTERLARGEILGRLASVPIGLKDVFYTAHLLTTASSKSLRDFVPDHDATSVAALRRDDAVVLGKLHTAEFAASDPAPTRNAWNRDHTPGGSSAGSGAAVAAGLVPVALGTQTGGSTLRPAAYNGIVGLKPSHGLVSNFGVIPLAWSFDHVGILARSVLDAALVLESIAGYDERDPLSVKGRADSFALTDGEPAIPPRIGLVRSFFLERCEPDVLAETERAALLLEGAGAAVNEVDLPASFPAIAKTYADIARSETAAYHEEAFAARGDDYGPNIATMVKAGLRIPASEYVRAQRERSALVADLQRMFDGIDLLLTPTTPRPAPRDRSTTGDASYLIPFSFAGMPSVSLPSGLSSWGLPYGIQLIGERWNDAGLIQAALWCEAVLQFKARPPSWNE